MVAEAGGVVPLEVGHGDSRRQEPQAGDFQPVIENGNEDGSPGDRIVPVADRIDQGFPESQRRVERHILPFQFPGSK